MKSSLPWADKVAKYLEYRRSLGFTLTSEQTLLNDFANFATRKHDLEYLTVELAAAWARASKRLSPITWAHRIEVIRPFAKYLRRLDERTQIPQRDLFGPSHRRLVPHIYTEKELFELLDATSELLPLCGLRPAACKAIFGLLASTGLRSSEAVNLTRADFDRRLHVLHIRQAKFHKERWVPIHPSVSRALCSYEKLRDQIVSNPRSEHLFLLDNGKPVNRRGVNYALRHLCEILGWKPRGDHKYHRLHDFRHTFIVRRVLRNYQTESTPDEAVVSLSTYVGHAKVADTYWYFTATPELLSIAAKRFHTYFQGGVK